MMPNAWLGRARPLNDSDVARAYWCTDTDISWLMYAYAPNAHRAHFHKVPGPAVLDMRCVDCGEAYTATSRGNAQTALSWERDYCCGKCRSERQILRFRKEGEERKARLARDEELRWMPYRDYLGTDEWSERRRTVIRKADFKCQVCAAGGRLHVHHRTYARRGVERIEDMIALCPICHDLFHSHGRLAQNGRAA